MRACVLTATGGIDKLQIKEVPDAPAPRAGEVRVAIRAAALNHLDLFVADGLPGGGAPPSAFRSWSGQMARA